MQIRVDHSANGNTYIEFSFEKSLRKYQKPPHKKIKTNTCTNAKHSVMKDYCVCRINSRSRFSYSENKNVLKNNKYFSNHMTKQKVHQFSCQKSNANCQQSQSQLKSVFNLQKSSLSEFHQEQSTNQIQNHFIVKRLFDQNQQTNKINITQIQKYQIDQSFSNITFQNQSFHNIPKQQTLMEEQSQVQNYINQQSFKSLKSISLQQQKCEQFIQAQYERAKQVSIQESLNILKMESKQQLKEQYKKQLKTRTFFKIKRIQDVQTSIQQCQSLSQKLRRQLQPQQKSYEQNISSQNVQIQQESSKQTQMIDQTKNFPYKRQRSSVEDQIVVTCLLKSQRKTKRLNFQFDKGYLNFGRIRLNGLGKQDLCLSLRNFTKHRKEDLHQVISRLIIQRPYLQAYKQELQQTILAILSQTH